MLCAVHDERASSDPSSTAYVSPYRVQRLFQSTHQLILVFKQSIMYNRSLEVIDGLGLCYMVTVLISNVYGRSGRQVLLLRLHLPLRLRRWRRACVHLGLELRFTDLGFVLVESQVSDLL